jgi:hypothetical protein
MYEPALVFHSWMRWAVLMLAVVAIARALIGYSRGNPWTTWDGRAGLLLTLALDIEVLVGLTLYFILTPFAQILVDDFATAMRVGVLRFWTVEHATAMMLALGAAHVGRARIKRTVDARARHRIALVSFAVALVAILAGIPWPGTADTRPLFRF